MDDVLHENTQVYAGNDRGMYSMGLEMLVNHFANTITSEEVHAHNNWFLWNV